MKFGGTVKTPPSCFKLSGLSRIATSHPQNFSSQVLYQGEIVLCQPEDEEPSQPQ